MSVLDGLNEKQTEAVLETEGYVRVIAGAGSGKTKLLVSRYAYLVQDYGIDSANILCVTFTNKAAGEMKRRIKAIIGPEHDTTLICTYHGFCNRLLRENPEKIFMTKQFQIIDEHQQKSMLEEIYRKYELQLDYASYESILHKVAQKKSTLEYVPAMCSPAPCQILPEIRDQDDRIIEDFMQRQKAVYALDFHDLLSFTLYLLQTDREVREKWQQRLNYIQVDEFQDSAGPEMKLVELLSAYYQNLMIVGDPDQNIYEWRGSDVRLLVDFDKNHEGTKTIFLNRNYRSTPQILQCANTLIEKNRLRLKKDLYTRHPDGASVVHVHSKNDFEEMDTVISQIKELQKKGGYRYSDFAVLYRSSFLSRVAEKKLVERNIPYDILGGVKFYQRMEIQDIMAYLRLIAFDDDASFRRIINKPRRQFGQAKLNRLLELQESNERLFGERQSLFATLMLSTEQNLFRESELGPFIRLITRIREAASGLRISEIVNRVTADSGYEQYIRALGDEERLDNLAEFKRMANEFEKDFGENVSLAGFLQQLALQSGEDVSGEQDAVKLMTIHSSKGLEFPVVFILGFSEGIFPSSKTVEERKNLGLEEERRLCYVAITRAKEHLFLLDSEGPTQNGNRKLLSRFLSEIGERNYVTVGRISDDLRQESRAYAARIGFLWEEEAVERRVGDEVEHHILGKGRILSIDEKRGSYQIKFDRLPLPRMISRNYFNRKQEKAEREAAKTAGIAAREQSETVLQETPGREAGNAARAVVEEQTESVSRETAEGAAANMVRASANERAEKGIQKETGSAVDRPVGVAADRTAEVAAEEKAERAAAKTAGIAAGEQSETALQERTGRAAGNAARTAANERVEAGIQEEAGSAVGRPAGAAADRTAEAVAGENGENAAAKPAGTAIEEQAETVLRKTTGSEAANAARVGANERVEEGIQKEAGSAIGRPAFAATGMPVEAAAEEKTEKKAANTAGTTADKSVETITHDEPVSPAPPRYPSELQPSSDRPESGDGAAASSGPDAGRKKKLEELKRNSSNLWKREDVPHSGWECEGVSDLGAPVGICEMCGYQIIRYAHHMYHKDYGHLVAGCVCAGKMEGDIEAARKRESELKKRMSRKSGFFQREWKKSQKGNEYLKEDGHIIVLYQVAGTGRWKYSLDNAFSRVVYASRTQVLEAVFEKLEELKGTASLGG